MQKIWYEYEIWFYLILSFNTTDKQGHFFHILLHPSSWHRFPCRAKRMSYAVWNHRLPMRTNKAWRVWKLPNLFYNSRLTAPRTFFDRLLGTRALNNIILTLRNINSLNEYTNYEKAVELNGQATRVSTPIRLRISSFLCGCWIPFSS